LKEIKEKKENTNKDKENDVKGDAP